MFWGRAMQKRAINKERRSSAADRRQHTGILPLTDSDGYEILLERRYFPDRRISHYNPDWCSDDNGQ
jgi:hypothetical protein